MPFSSAANFDPSQRDKQCDVGPPRRAPSHPASVRPHAAPAQARSSEDAPAHPDETLHPSSFRSVHESVQDAPYASVIIPCRDCLDVIGFQLDALARQQLERPWEVLLVDNGGNEGFEAVLEPFRERLPGLRLLAAQEVRGSAHARNWGAAQARGELLLFVDADDEVGEGWLEAMVAALKIHDFVACRVDFDKLNPEAAGRARRNTQQWGLQQYTYPDFLPHAAGGTLGIRRAVHDEVGGFNTELYKLQDTDYCWRVQIAGHALHFVPDALIHYRLRETLRETVRQAFRYGEYNVKLYSLYQDCGMGKITLRQGLRAWYYLLRSLPDLFRLEDRARVLWSLVWRFGRLYGSLRYRVFAV